MAAAFEPHYPVGVAVLLEAVLDEPGGTCEAVFAYVEGFVKHYLVLGAVEEAGGSGNALVLEVALGLEYGSGIGYDGGGFPAFGEHRCFGTGVDTAVVGLEHGDGTGAAAGEDDFGWVDD